MVTEEREPGSLIGSDEVEGTAVFGGDDAEIGSIERVMIDKLTGKVICRFELWRLPRNGGRPLSTALAVVEVRHRSRRLPHRHYASSAPRSAEIQQRQ